METLQTNPTGRPIGPNKITGVMNEVFVGQKEGEELVNAIAETIEIQPAYRDKILSDMECFDREAGYLRPNHLSYCADCPFGPSVANTRTLCTEYVPEEIGGGVEYVVEPATDYLNGRMTGQLEFSIALGIDELEEQGYVRIPRRQISKLEKGSGLGFSTSVLERRANARKIIETVYKMGMRIPSTYHLNSIGQTGDTPLVVKNIGAHRGDQKFFVENTDQKCNLLA